MNQLNHWIRKIMTGRYGMDQLSLALLGTSLLLFLILTPFHNRFLSLLPVLPLILSYYRIFSKKLYKRQQENFKFVRWSAPYKKKALLLKKQFSERKTHRYYRCPNCHQSLRVPKGRGKLLITCPKCHQSFHKNT